MIEIRLLKYFSAVVEEGSFIKASNRLHITQPTLSRQIKELEDYYQIKLFDRTQTPIKVTNEGLQLYHKTRKILELSEKLDRDLRNKEEIKGVIDIGAVESKGAEAIYKDLIEISKFFPQIRFNFYHSDSDDIKEKLDRGILDIGVLTEPVELSHYNYLKLPETDKWFILISKKNKLAEKEKLSWKDIRTEPLLLPKRFSNLGEIPDFFNSEISSFDILATYSLFSNAVYFVEEDLAVAPCIQAVHSIKNNKNVISVPLSPEFSTGSYLVWKKEQIMNKPAQTILNKLIELINKRNT